MPFKRDLFTGELVEVEATPDGRVLLYREEIPEHLQQNRTSCNPYAKEWETETLAVPIEQMQKFNEDAKRMGTGAYYKPGKDGQYANLVCPTRKSRARELKRRGAYDRDAGYGDYAG